MRFAEIEASQWKEVKSIYMEAFPKRERKPFFVLKHSVKRGKARVFTASDENGLLGFAVAIPYQNMVMVDYLAVSGKIRSKGTGSFIMQEICQYFSDKKVVLLIEQLDEGAENREQRIARRRFYLKNGFTSADIFVEGAGGGYGDPELWREGISGGLYVSSEVCPGKTFVQSVGNADRGAGRGVRKPPVRGHNSSMGYIWM